MENKIKLIEAATKELIDNLQAHEHVRETHGGRYIGNWFNQNGTRSGLKRQIVSLRSVLQEISHMLDKE